MNRFTAIFPSSPGLTPARRNLLLCAAVVAVSLMSFYVHLLQQSVERGEQRRIDQRSAASRPVMKPALSTLRFGEGVPRQTAYDTDIAAR